MFFSSKHAELLNLEGTGRGEGGVGRLAEKNYVSGCIFQRSATPLPVPTALVIGYESRLPYKCSALTKHLFRLVISTTLLLLCFCSSCFFVPSTKWAQYMVHLHR